MSTIIIYSIAVVSLIASLIKSREKTKAGLKKAWRAFENIHPQLLLVLFLVSVILAFLNTDIISKIIGKDSGALGVILAALIGAIALVPPFIAFPTASLLLDSGAGIMQIAAFISTLMMVGVASIPIEITYFGKKMAIGRNILAFILAFIVAILVSLVVGQ